ncbi:MAG: protein kinase, partial [Dehalococcoidia bacterium]|nr:protein kinase [Dehalococcoidia bacterium]
MSLIGAQIGPYHVTAQIGQGGMATVYRATHTTLGRDVAIKVLLPSLTDEPEFVRRFEREARVVAGLDHPNILPIYDFGRHDDLFYLVTPYLDGGALGDRGAPMPVAEAVGYVRQIAAGLAYAHERGVIHRDIKPSNVLLTADGRAVLADFGIARLVGDSTRYTQTGHLLGTPTYLSPEQARGGVATPQSDIYALAVVLYQLLEGRAPFESDNPVSVLYQHAHEPPPPLTRPDLPASLVHAVNRALAKSPDDRFPTATAFARAIDGESTTTTFAVAPARTLVGETMSAPDRPQPKAPTTPIARRAEAMRAPRQRTWAIAGGVGALTVAFVAIAAVSLAQPGAGSSSQPTGPTRVETPTSDGPTIPPALATAQVAAATVQAG